MLNKVAVHVDEKVLEESLKKYKVDTQIIKTIEELSELIQVLCKGWDGKKFNPDEKTLFNISDEMADVVVMLCYLIKIYGNREQTSSRVLFKMGRQKERLSHGKNRGSTSA